MKKKPIVLNTLEALGNILTPSYAKGGVVTKTFDGVLENAELRAKLTPKPQFNIGEDYLSNIQKQSPIEHLINSFDTFGEMMDYLDLEGSHEKNRLIVRDQANIIANIPDGQRIVDDAKEYCRAILSIPEHYLTAEYHGTPTKFECPTEPVTVYIDPMKDEQRELQYGAHVDPMVKRVSLLAKNKRRY